MDPDLSPDDATLSAWSAEPTASAADLARMTEGRHESRRVTLKAVRTRLDRGTLGHVKLGNIRIIPRSEALRTGLVTPEEWPAEGAPPAAPDVDTSPRPQVVTPTAAHQPATPAREDQQPAVVDMRGIVEKVAELAAAAAEGRLLTAQAGERERELARERRLMEERIAELRTTNLALTQRLEAEADRAEEAAARAADHQQRIAQLEASLAACEQVATGAQVEVDDRGGTVRQAAETEARPWWGRLIGRSVVP